MAANFCVKAPGTASGTTRSATSAPRSRATATCGRHRPRDLPATCYPVAVAFLPSLPQGVRESGRRGSNLRPQAWKANQAGMWGTENGFGKPLLSLWAASSTPVSRDRVAQILRTSVGTPTAWLHNGPLAVRGTSCAPVPRPASRSRAPAGPVWRATPLPWSRKVMLRQRDGLADDIKNGVSGQLAPMAAIAQKPFLGRFDCRKAFRQAPRFGSPGS